MGAGRASFIAYRAPSTGSNPWLYVLWGIMVTVFVVMVLKGL